MFLFGWEMNPHIYATCLSTCLLFVARVFRLILDLSYFTIDVHATLALSPIMSPCQAYGRHCYLSVTGVWWFERYCSERLEGLSFVSSSRPASSPILSPFQASVRQTSDRRQCVTVICQPVVFRGFGRFCSEQFERCCRLCPHAVPHILVQVTIYRRLRIDSHLDHACIRNLRYMVTCTIIRFLHFSDH